MTQKIKERPDGSLRVQTVNKEPTLTKTSFKDECDINLIINRYDNTGLITHLNAAEALYGDVTELGDYQDAMDRVVAVNELFMSLPAKTREIFNNSPAEFLDHANDPEKRSDLISLGIIQADPSDLAPTPAPPGGAGPETSPPDPDPAPGGAGPEGSTS